MTKPCCKKGRIASQNANERGIGLIEFFIAMAVGLIIFLAAGQMFSTQVDVQVLEGEMAEMRQNARLGMDIMLRQMRMAGYDPTGAANAGITAADSNSMTFSMDLNEDGDTADAQESLTVSLYDADADGDLDLGYGGAEVVSENIDALAFVYTLADGSTTSSPADPNQIRKVNLTLTGRTERASRSGQHEIWTVSSSLVIRNMALKE